MKQQTIDLIEKEYRCYCKKTGRGGGVLISSSIREVAEHLINFAFTNPEILASEGLSRNEWIPVSERLPTIDNQFKQTLTSTEDEQAVNYCRNDKVLRWHSMVHEVAHLIEISDLGKAQNILAKLDNEMHESNGKELQQQKEDWQREAAEKAIFWAEEYLQNKEATVDGVAAYLNLNYPIK